MVLSPGFQDSAWCLEELRLTWHYAAQQSQPDRHLKVVFAGVKPGAVDETALAAALCELRQQGHMWPGVTDAAALADWRKALRSVGAVTGWLYNPQKECVPDCHTVVLFAEVNSKWQ